jgi:hypothetical protein
MAPARAFELHRRRTLIYRAIKKLEGVISVAYAIPGLKQYGWTFERDARFPDRIPDEVNGFHYLYEAYVASNSADTGKVTVPTLWDKKTKRIAQGQPRGRATSPIPFYELADRGDDGVRAVGATDDVARC